MDDLATLIRRMGGPTSVARLCGIQTPSVYSWKRIPADHAAKLEAGTGVRRWEMRPDDWGAIWPELIGADGAPDWPAGPAALDAQQPHAVVTVVQPGDEARVLFSDAGAPAAVSVFREGVAP